MLGDGDGDGDGDGGDSGGGAVPAPFAGLGWAPRPSFAALARAYAPS